MEILESGLPGILAVFEVLEILEVLEVSKTWEVQKVFDVLKGERFSGKFCTYLCFKLAMECG